MSWLKAYKPNGSPYVFIDGAPYQPVMGTFARDIIPSMTWSEYQECMKETEEEESK